MRFIRVASKGVYADGSAIIYLDPGATSIARTASTSRQFPGQSNRLETEIPARCGDRFTEQGGGSRQTRMFGAD